ncbi:chaplin family protein [Streptomyces sp. NPDC051907]|uniref:chaplin n=1 Tax=Streptomyces sp. NPDC051907 TaxID=3155284 RepID=UPI0034293E76
MRQVHRKGLAAVMLTGGALALTAGYAQADSHADGGAAESPGLLAGNTVQLPVNVPVNVCGNTVNVVGLLNPAAGNTCANKGGGDSHGAHNEGGASAEGGTTNSPGVISGNGIQLPVDLPVNVSGNSVNVVGLLNPAIGNTSANIPGHPPVPEKPTKPVEPVKPVKPATPPKAVKPHQPEERDVAVVSPASGALAETGSGSIAYAVPAGAALLLGGAVLYRRFRPQQERSV